MTTLTKTAVLAVICSASAAHAAAAPGTATGFITYLFLGFLALVLAFQLIPGMMLFFGMLKGLFTSASRKETAKAKPEKAR